MHEQARGIDLEIFTVDVEFLAIGAYATARPFSADAKIGSPFGDAVHILSAPPARHLGWIGESLEDTGGRSGDEDLAGNCVVVGGDCNGCHEFSPRPTKLESQKQDQRQNQRRWTEVSVPHIT